MADRQYELVYILPPDTTEQQVTELHGQLEAVVSRLHGPRALHAVDLAHIFSRMMRRLIAQHFRDIRSNDDVRKYRTARRILEGPHRWMEDGLVPGEELEKLAASAYAQPEDKELATVS